MRSALYRGAVTHHRRRPRRHGFRYRVFSLLVDLDELAELGTRSRLLAINRRGILSFHERDHGDGGLTPLRNWVDARLANAGIAIPGGRVEVLSYPRMFGYVFNPLSVFFCWRADGALAAILYEVANTYSEKHTYVIPASSGDGVNRQTADKVFYVSPFLPVGGRYRFSIRPPHEAVGLTINVEDEDGLLLTATFKGRRHELSGAALVKVLFAYPLMTLKVVACIHWEALKLWRKGIRFRDHAAAAEAISVSVVAPGRIDAPRVTEQA